MKQLLEAINRGILRGLNENNIELLADLEDDDLDLLDSILTKSVNDKIDGYILLVKLLLINAINTEQISESLKEIINNPNNYDKFKGIVKATDKIHLKKLIGIGLTLFGNNGNFNWIDVSDIKDMTVLFSYSQFNGDISKWDVSNVQDMGFMFSNSKFNGDISKWDVSNVTGMYNMFFISKFNRDISKWNVSNVKNMCSMFKYSKFKGDISKWDVSNVKDMNYMFSNTKFNGDISKWDVSNVQDMDGMFYHSKFNNDISKWNIDKNCSTIAIFDECPIKDEYKPKCLKMVK